MRNKLAWYLVICGISVLLVFGCGRVADTVARVTGTILAADGTTAIVGATVYYKADATKSTTTNGSGQFTLEGDWLVAGTYTLVASKGSFRLEFVATVEADNSTTALGNQLISSSNPDATIPDIGVVLGNWDKIENIITALGYPYVTLEATDFDNYAYLNTFEAIFINCGDSLNLTALRKTNLQNFVEAAGGSLYTSDYAGAHIESIWPEAIIWYGGSVEDAKVGNIQTLEARVIDANLQAILGKSKAEISYDLDDWVVVSSEGSGTTVLLSGNPRVSNTFSLSSTRVRSFDSPMIFASGTLEAVPLAVKFHPAGAAKGTVIYTTFHNEAQEDAVTQDARKILQDFIFSL